MKLSIVILFFIITASSCSMLESTPYKGKFNQNDLNPSISSLNSSYKLHSTDSSIYLLNQIFSIQEDSINNSMLSDLSINLYVLDDSHIEARLMQNQRQIKAKRFKGEFKDRSFITKTKYSVPTFWFILNFVSMKKIRFGALENGNLILDFQQNGVLFITIFPFRGASNKVSCLEFEKR